MEMDRLSDVEIQSLIENPLINAPYKEFEKLRRLEEIAKLEKEIEESESGIFNLSIQEICTNIADTFIGILLDLFSYSKELKNYDIMSHIFSAFTKKNRLIYIGIVIIITVLISKLID